MAKRNQKPNRKTEDSVIYKAILDLAIVSVGVMLLQLIGKHYGYADSYTAWNAAFRWISIISAILFAGGAVLTVSKKTGLQKLGLIGAAVFGVLSVCTWSLFKFWYVPLPYLYFFLIAGCVLYLIDLLYPRDFTLIAVLATAAGGVFYLHGWQGIASLTTLVLYLVVAAALLLSVVLAMKAAKRSGTVVIGKRTYRLFSGRSGPIPLYLTVTILAACITASLFFGGAFAYYCTYAAAGGLFIAACYYTIRLD